MVRRLFSSLLPRILLAIVLGILCGLFFPDGLARVFTTFNAIFGAFLGFIIPVLILALVAPAIADLGRGAGRWLLITAIVAYVSTLVAGFAAFATGMALFPPWFTGSEGAQALSDPSDSALAPYFEIGMPPVMDIMTALLLAFCMGVGITLVNGTALHRGLDELRQIVMRIVTALIIPLLPVYVFGSFLSLTMNGAISSVIAAFVRVIVVALVLTVLILLVQYGIAGLIARRNPIAMLKNALPAYFTALGTASSAATIPVSLRCARRNGVSEEVAGFTIPLCATIHLAGSTMKIVLTALALLMLTGRDVDTLAFVGFIFMLGVTMIAAPGVPGGAIMAAAGVLSSMLGFDDAMVSIMIAIYVAIDSFGTACNVTGDGAIAVGIDSFYQRGRRRRERQEQLVHA